MECVADKPISYYAFEMLYWTGVREGELLALTPSDYKMSRPNVQKILYKNVQLVCLS